MFSCVSKTLISHYIIAVRRCDELKEGERETTECDWSDQKWSVCSADSSWTIATEACRSVWQISFWGEISFSHMLLICTAFN